MTLQWNTAVAAGSRWIQTFTFPDTDITGLVWEFVVRINPADTGTPLIKVTEISGAQGQILVDTVASTVQVIVTATATAPLGKGAYSHALWSNAGDATADLAVSGIFNTSLAAKP